MKPFLTHGGALRGNAAPAATLLTAAATLLRIESRDACILGLRNSRHGYLMLMARFSQIVTKISLHTQIRIFQEQKVKNRYILTLLEVCFRLPQGMHQL